jgi:hypothetical protein
MFPLGKTMRLWIRLTNHNIESNGSFGSIFGLTLSGISSHECPTVKHVIVQEEPGLITSDHIWQISKPTIGHTQETPAKESTLFISISDFN